jgi:putative peptidoglycan lipid II flippase
MAVGTAMSRLTGFARLIVLAVVLGVKPLADAFNLGNNTPNMLYDLLLGGVLSSTLVPVLSARFSLSGERQGARSLSVVMTFGLLGLVAATLVFELLAPGIIDLYTVANHQDFAPLERMLATELLRLFAPQLFFYGAIALFTAFLNVRGNFAAPAFAPIVNNVVAIASLAVFDILYHHPTLKSVQNHPGAILLLGLGATAGVACQALALLPAMWHLGIKPRMRLAIHDPALREIFTLSPWTFGFVFLNQVALFVVLALADTRAGFVSAYNYGYLFFQLPYAIISLSVMSAVQPRLARLFATGDLWGFRRELSRSLRISVATTIPLAILMFFGSETAIELLLGYGAVGSHGVDLTAASLRGFALGLPGFALFLSIVQGLQAVRDLRSVFYLYVLENGLNVVFALILIRHMGVFGLSASLAIAYTAAGVVAIWLVWRKRLVESFRKLARSWIHIAVVSAVAALVLAVTLPQSYQPPSVDLAIRAGASLLVSMGIFAVVVSVLAKLGAHKEERS